MTRTPKAIDLTLAAYTTFGAGIKRGNPRICFICHKPIRKGQLWTCDHSAATGKQRERIVVIHHTECTPRASSRKPMRKAMQC